ncbi:MAG: GNAT family N-acetyltransferase [Bacteriovoracaceae bacterium]|jgi:ribosomal protein S18 acetylase RimI-like enzyme|nr:GNAT family N-acetyltransferase [Bacteriovoracaceae bacterium]
MNIIQVTDKKYIDTIVQCQLSMAKETENLNLDPKLLHQGVKSVIEDSNKGTYYIALNENDEFMGMLLTMNEWSDWRCKNVLWIHSVYVLPQFRSHGVFKSLYNHLKLMVSNSDDLVGLRLYVDKTNTSAIEVYKKVGMSDEHYGLFEWLK